MFKKIRIEFTEMIDRLRKGILQVFTANVLNKIFVMVSNMIITRILTKAEYGLWSYVLNVYSYASLITGLGLASGAFLFGVENRDTRKKYDFFRYCLTVGLIINSIISTVFIFGSFVVQHAIDGAGVYIQFYVPVLLLEYTVEILSTMLRCDERIKEYARVMNVNTLLVVAFTCIGAFAGIPGVIAGKYVAAICSVLYLLKLTKKESHLIKSADALSRAEKRDLWHYSLFTGLSSTLNRVLYLIDVSMIATLMKNAVDVANYKVATLIPNSLGFIPSSVIIVIMPNIVANNRNYPWLRKNVKKTYIWLFLLNAFIGIVLITLAPFIIAIISGVQYLDSVAPFRVLVLGYVIAGTFRSLSTNVLAGLRHVGFNLVISVSSGIADIILNYFLIRKHGMMGAAYATLGVEIIASVISMVFIIYVLVKEKGVKRNA